jgi:hypothetical protein
MTKSALVRAIPEIEVATAPRRLRSTSNLQSERLRK